MNICVGCQKEFFAGDSRQKHCSKDCWTHFQSLRMKNKPGAAHSDETKRKIAEAVALYHASKGTLPKKVKMTAEQRQISGFNGAAKRAAKKVQVNANKTFDELSAPLRFKRVKEEQDQACNGCHLKFWRDQPITLEIEHKDGNNTNNARDNLEALCPNCHSQTSTWRGRNARKRVTDEEMIVALKAHPSITQAMLSLGLAAKGGNFARAKRLLGLPEGAKLTRSHNNLKDFT